MSKAVIASIRPDTKLKVRLIEKPVEVVKIFSKNRKCAVVESEQTGKQLKMKYPRDLSDISVRYACWCIDRADNRMKVLDMPVSIARAFGKRQALIGKAISEFDEGCDWQIMTNGRTGKEVRYDAVYLKESPLTEEEKKMVEDQKEGKDGYYDLRHMFKGLSFEEAEEKLFG